MSACTRARGPLLSLAGRCRRTLAPLPILPIPLRGCGLASTSPTAPACSSPFHGWAHGHGAPSDPHDYAPRRYGTTVLCVRKGDQVVIIADGQCTAGGMVVKPNVRKVRKLGADGTKIGGFAGATADAFTLFEKLESSLEAHSGQLTRAAVELAKTWRTDKFLRQLNVRAFPAFWGQGGGGLPQCWSQLQASCSRRQGSDGSTPPSSFPRGPRDVPHPHPAL